MSCILSIVPSLDPGYGCCHPGCRSFTATIQEPHVSRPWIITFHAPNNLLDAVRVDRWLGWIVKSLDDAGDGGGIQAHLLDYYWRRGFDIDGENCLPSRSMDDLAAAANVESGELARQILRQELERGLDPSPTPSPRPRV
jgi:hypothetical protein